MAQSDSTMLAEIATAVGTLGGRQGVVMAMLGELTGAVAAQTEMLRDILTAATEEPGPSATAEALAAVATALRENTAALTGIEAEIARLPEEIVALITEALGPVEPEC